MPLFRQEREGERERDKEKVGVRESQLISDNGNSSWPFWLAASCNNKRLQSKLGVHKNI